MDVLKGVAATRPQADTEIQNDLGIDRSFLREIGMHNQVA